MNRLSEKKSNERRWKMRWCAIAAVVASAFSVPALSLAFDIGTGNPDLIMRWDNTFRYSLATRVSDQDPHILASPNNDDGDRNFNKGIVSNRLDVLSEFDLTFKRRHGFRISAAGWYDNAYEGNRDNNSIATSNLLENGRPALGLSDYAKRLYRGPDGEILDSFVFTGFDAGDIPVNLKFGRHTVFWGEGLLLGGIIHGISYGQSSIDAQKAFAIPGTEAKELFRPRHQISMQAQPFKTLSVMAQYFFDYEPARLPEGGTYLGSLDMLQFGGQSLIVAPGVRFKKGPDINPDNSGDWGVGTRWTPDWLQGTLGVYYRYLSDILPQLVIRPATGQYFLNYGGNIKLLGFSFSKDILGISVGSELSYRWNMPLNSDAVSVASLPAAGETSAARGNTIHALINFLGTLPRTMLFEGGSWNMELTWNRWDTVTQNPSAFKGRDSYTQIDKVAKDAFGLGLNFSPTWYQVFPGADLSLPLSFSMGLSGNSAVANGGNEKGGTYSVGLSLDFRQKYTGTLQYINWFGDYTTAPNGSIQTANGGNALLNDRGQVVFTVKTTF